MRSLKKYRIISSRSSLCLSKYLFVGIKNEEGYVMQDTRSIHDSMLSLIHVYLHFIINIQNIEIIYYLGNKTVLYLICNCINGFVLVAFTNPKLNLGKLPKRQF